MKGSNRVEHSQGIRGWISMQSMVADHYTEIVCLLSTSVAWRILFLIREAVMFMRAVIQVPTRTRTTGMLYQDNS